MERAIRRLIETDEMPTGQISVHAQQGQNVRNGARISRLAESNDTGIGPIHRAGSFGEAP